MLIRSQELPTSCMRIGAVSSVGAGSHPNCASSRPTPSSQLPGHVQRGFSRGIFTEVGSAPRDSSLWTTGGVISNGSPRRKSDCTAGDSAYVNTCSCGARLCIAIHAAWSRRSRDAVPDTLAVACSTWDHCCT